MAKHIIKEINAGFCIIILIVCSMCVAGTASKFKKTEAAKTAKAIDIAYNIVNYESGVIEYTAEIRFNHNVYANGRTISETNKIDKAAEQAINTLKIEFAKKGYKLKGLEIPNYLRIELGVYESAEELAIKNGETGYDNLDYSNYKTTKGFYYNTYISKNKTVFANMIENNILKILEIEVLRIENFTANDINYVYNYGTSVSPKRINTDADKIFKGYFYPDQFDQNSTKEELIIHQFIMNSSNINTREVTFIQRIPNALGWNLTLILIAIIAFIVFLGVMYYTKKKPQNKISE